MKPNAASALIFVLGLVTCASNGRSLEKADEANPSAKVVQDAELTPIAATPDASAAQWADIKDVTYDSRAQFFSGLTLLNTKVDLQVDELNARRAAMTSAANPKDWDFAMKEMINARAYLISTGKEMNSATPETWNQQKEKVGIAWTRTQDAYTKVKSSVTN